MNDSADGISIVIFSSGLSEKSGLIQHLKYRLESYGYMVSQWRDLFEQAQDQASIALLPMLVKKIPSFDYAVLVCEGHDETILFRDGQEVREKTMRDNVLFEIGLCTMALGLEKVILLTEESVRLPEDLTGIQNGQGLPVFLFDPWNVNAMAVTAEQIHNVISRTDRSIEDIQTYIHRTSDITSPMVVGAASATAVSYVRNFIFRLIEKLDQTVRLDVNDQEAGSRLIQEGQWDLQILLPENLNPEALEGYGEQMKSYRRGVIEEARYRPLYFSYWLEDGWLHIVDFPSIMTVSYDTVRRILAFEADDQKDEQAEKRFQNKEIKLFAHTLTALLSDSYVDDVCADETGLLTGGMTRAEKLKQGIRKVTVSFKD